MEPTKNLSGGRSGICRKYWNAWPDIIQPGDRRRISMFLNSFMTEEVHLARYMVLITQRIRGDQEAFTKSWLPDLGTSMQLRNFQDVVPAVIPFFHIYGFTVLQLNAAVNGTKLITVPRFQPDSFISVLKNHGITALYAAPTLAMFLAHHDGIKTEYFDRLKFFMSGGAPLGYSDEKRVQEKIGKNKLIFQVAPKIMNEYFSTKKLKQKDLWTLVMTTENPIMHMSLDMTDALSDLKNSSPGHDNITYAMINNMPLNAKTQLLNSNNMIWLTGIYPRKWNETIVIPLPKENEDPTSTSSYRPIALTCCFSKVFEKMIHAPLVFAKTTWAVFIHTGCDRYFSEAIVVIASFTYTGANRLPASNRVSTTNVYPADYMRRCGVNKCIGSFTLNALLN
ncbi:hypothetical protein JTB14_031527 [Gonioctena quinquepunctata]|nr:hypothetical protein JTB14_031527 [Gonioctena quinquepunctata]